MGKINFETGVIVAGVLIVMLLGGGCAFYFGRTLVSLWAVLSVTLPLGVASAWMARGVLRRLLGSVGTLYPVMFGAAVFTALITFAFLCVNYSASSDEVRMETVTVERLFTRTRHRTRRERRRYAYSGPEYKVYYMAVSFSDGREKEIYLGERGFGRRRRGDRLDFELKTGAFGIPVITSLSTPSSGRN